MFRIVFIVCFSIVFSRWVYAEVDQAFPNMTPVIDYALERVQIPTHDQWNINMEAVSQFLGSVPEVLAQEVEEIHRERS